LYQRLNEVKKLIYVSDPQCGWCYGNSENILSIYHEFQGDFEFELLNGGMWVGENAPTGGEKISNYIQSQAPRLMSYTGVTISDAYFEMIKDSNYVLSSLEPCSAIMAVKQMDADAVIEFSKEVQLAQFKFGKSLNELASYLPILKKMGLNAGTFEALWLSESNLELCMAEFEIASKIVQGFPTLLVQDGKELTVLASGYFNLEEMREDLKGLMKM